MDIEMSPCKAAFINLSSSEIQEGFMDKDFCKPQEPKDLNLRHILLTP